VKGGGGQRQQKLLSCILDVHCVAVISPYFPYKPTVGIVQRQKSSFFPPVEG